MSDNMKLIGKEVSYIEVDYGDFENLVAETYGVNNCSFPACEECNNDTSHDYSVSKGETLDDYEKKRLQKFIDNDGTKCYTARILFVDLYNKGLIPHGNYLVQVSW